jgi:hypothetical protein
VLHDVHTSQCRNIVEETAEIVLGVTSRYDFWHLAILAKIAVIWQARHRAVLLRSQMGKTGGVRLARPAAEITLRDIYSAVVADAKIWPPELEFPVACVQRCRLAQKAIPTSFLAIWYSRDSRTISRS